MIFKLLCVVHTSIRYDIISETRYVRISKLPRVVSTRVGTTVTNRPKLYCFPPATISTTNCGSGRRDYARCTRHTMHYNNGSNRSYSIQYSYKVYTYTYIHVFFLPNESDARSPGATMQKLRGDFVQCHVVF